MLVRENLMTDISANIDFVIIFLASCRLLSSPNLKISKRMYTISLLFQLIDYERVINIAHSIYFVLLLLIVSSCSLPPKPEIVSLDENKVATEARQIRNSVSVELADSLKLSL